MGATGMLGKRVVQEAEQRGHTVVAPAVRFGEYIVPVTFSSMDVIINCAGIIPAKMPSPEHMIQVNSLGPWQLARVACEWNTRLVHMSTDCVFSGEKIRSLNTQTLPDPIDLYGRSKLTGEPSGKNVVVVRGSFIGLEHGFLYWLLREKGLVQAWTKAMWNGGSVKIMAHALVDLAESDVEGVVHVAAETPVSKAWMIEYLIDALDLHIDAINFIREPSIWRALEPDIVLPPVKDSLDELVEEAKATEEEWRTPLLPS